MSVSKLKIWVVEDDATYQKMLVAFLKVIGYQAEGFFSGEECLAYLDERPDIVLLDHHLGDGIPGMEVLRKIKTHNKNISVVYVSGEEEPSVIADAYRNGSDDYIGKDSASLLRLKLRLDKLSLVHKLRFKRSLTRTIPLCIGVAIISSLSAWIIYWLKWY